VALVACGFLDFGVVPIGSYRFEQSTFEGKATVALVGTYR